MPSAQFSRVRVRARTARSAIALWQNAPMQHPWVAHPLCSRACTPPLCKRAHEDTVPSLPPSFSACALSAHKHRVKTARQCTAARARACACARAHRFLRILPVPPVNASSMFSGKTCARARLRTGGQMGIFFLNCLEGFRVP